MADPAPSSFDPTRYLVNLKGSDYLEVKWRLVWLRTEYPEAKIDTELKTNEPDEAVFKAVIELPNGARASGWGSETAGDFRDYIEKAETKAIGRALAALGFGTQFCDDHNFGGDEPATLRVVDTPVDFASTRGRGVAQPPRPPQAGPNDITERQLRFLRSIAREVGLDEEALDLEAERIYGRRASGLSRADASALIERLQARRGAIGNAREGPPTPEPVAQPQPEAPVIEGFTQLWPVLRKQHGFKGTRKDLEALIGPFGEDTAQLVYERYLAHLNGRALSASEDGEMTPEQKAANKEMWRAASSLGIKDNDALKDVIRRLKREWAGIKSKRELTAQDMLDIADMLDSMQPAELQQLFEGEPQ